MFSIVYILVDRDVQGTCCGLQKCFKSATLSKGYRNHYNINDTVVFQVEITLNDEEKVRLVRHESIPPTERSESISADFHRTTSAPPSPPQGGFGDLLESGEGSDAKLIFQSLYGRTVHIPVHKLILSARSSVFKAMFARNLKKKKTNIARDNNEIVISDFSPKVIREMLHFMYTGTSTKPLTDAQFVSDLFSAALHFKVIKLVNVLLSSDLLVSLTTTNVIELYSLALSCRSQGELKKSIVHFICINAANIPNFDSFLEQSLLSACESRLSGIRVSHGSNGCESAEESKVEVKKIGSTRKTPTKKKKKEKTVSWMSPVRQQLQQQQQQQRSECKRWSNKRYG